MAANGGGTGGEEMILDTARSERGVWLMKVPRVVADAWKEAEGSSEQIGVVRMAFDPLKGAGDAATQFTLQLVGKGTGSGLPEKFNLNSTSTFIPTHIFSETSQGKLAVEGKVDRKFDMQVQASDAAYRNLVKSRDKMSNTPKRKLQVWDGNDGITSILPLPGLRDVKSKSGLRAAAAAKPSDTKRVRMGREALEALVFKLFEQQPYWGLRQLIDATQQPQVFLKEILSELCIYNKRGTHQGMYELKPEYQKTTSQEETKPTM